MFQLTLSKMRKLYYILRSRRKKYNFSVRRFAYCVIETTYPAGYICRKMRRCKRRL